VACLLLAWLFLVCNCAVFRLVYFGALDSGVVRQEYSSKAVSTLVRREYVYFGLIIN